MQPFATKLKIARKAAGLSQEALAQRMGITKQMVSKYELDQSGPNGSALVSASEALGQPIDYFFRETRLDFSTLSFRKRAKLIGRRLSQVQAEVADQVERALELESLLGLDASFTAPTDLSPSLVEVGPAVDAAAQALRERWHVGVDAIASMRDLLRAHAIRVIELELDSEFDGVSTVVDQSIGVVVINRHGERDAVRQRFTLAHELGHLVLPIPDEVSDKIAEKICNRFASALLLPTDALVTELGLRRTGISLTELKAIRCKWGISGAAVVYRAQEAAIVPARFAEDYWYLRRQDDDVKYERDWGSFPSERCGEDYIRVLAARALQQDAMSFSKAAGLLKVSIYEARALAMEPRRK